MEHYILYGSDTFYMNQPNIKKKKISSKYSNCLNCVLKKKKK